MKVKLWGVRGSIPTTGPETEKYGGNTSCASVVYDDHLLVLDGGPAFENAEVRILPVRG